MIRRWGGPAGAVDTTLHLGHGRFRSGETEWGDLKARVKAVSAVGQQRAGKGDALHVPVPKDAALRLPDAVQDHWLAVIVAIGADCGEFTQINWWAYIR